MAVKSLLGRSHPLSELDTQFSYLEGEEFAKTGLSRFHEKLKDSRQFPLKPKMVEVLQINLGYMCNQVCSHCHVDAGPDRKEIMTRETMEQCLKVLRDGSISTIDLTGGAPEMNPNFKWFVEMAASIGVKDFIVRSNLTIITANKRNKELPAFFAEHNIHVVSSLPFYKAERTDKQRGNGVFDQSIAALRLLNEVGYGKNQSELKLDLVYNPAGAFLPGDQKELENEFKKALKKNFNVDFNNLFTITNLPISRFLDYLIKSENYEDYMGMLVDAYNPSAVEGVMCKNTLSVGWDGSLYDCDFNQMLGMNVSSSSNHISNYDAEELEARDICISQHCFGCTAGAGSSCQGATV